MKVESVEAYPISIKAGEKLQGGTLAYSFFQTVLVKSVCDGVEGWGEAMTRQEPRATALIVRHLAKGITRRDHVSVASVWNELWRELRVRGHTRGVAVEALSGIEMSLYDCLAKIQRKPLNMLFGKAPMERVDVFAGSLFRSRGPLVGQVETAKADGMKGAKVKVGFGVESDTKTLVTVRKAWPDGMLVADANGAYDGATARKACAKFEDIGLAWFEEPVLSDDWEGYQMLRWSETAIGAGESWFVDDFTWPFKQKLIGVVEPSVSRCGGIGVEIDVAKRAASEGIGFSPMTGMNSAISSAVSIHVASVCPSVGVEFNPFSNPLQTDLAEGFPEPKDGQIPVPRGAGIGIAVDTRFLKANSS